jgi:hypothetical protein
MLIYVSGKIACIVSFCGKRLRKSQLTEKMDRINDFKFTTLIYYLVYLKPYFDVIKYLMGVIGSVPV